MAGSGAQLCVARRRIGISRKSRYEETGPDDLASSTRL